MSIFNPHAASVFFILALAACGGGGGTTSSESGSASSVAYTLGGTVTGLVTSGLVLANGDATLSVAANASKFSFASTRFGQR